MKGAIGRPMQGHGWGGVTTGEYSPFPDLEERLRTDRCTILARKMWPEWKRKAERGEVGTASVVRLTGFSADLVLALFAAFGAKERDAKAVRRSTDRVVVANQIRRKPGAFVKGKAKRLA